MTFSHWSVYVEIANCKIVLGENGVTIIPKKSEVALLWLDIWTCSLPHIQRLAV